MVAVPSVFFPGVTFNSVEKFRERNRLRKKDGVRRSFSPLHARPHLHSLLVPGSNEPRGQRPDSPFQSLRGPLGTRNHDFTLHTCRCALTQVGSSLLGHMGSTSSRCVLLGSFYFSLLVVDFFFRFGLLCSRLMSDFLILW